MTILMALADVFECRLCVSSLRNATWWKILCEKKVHLLFCGLLTVRVSKTDICACFNRENVWNFDFNCCPSTRLRHSCVSGQQLWSWGVCIHEDGECDTTFCGVDLWARLTAYAKGLEINDSSVKSHARFALYGTEHKGKCECVCVCVCATTVFALVHTYFLHQKRTSSFSIIVRPEHINLLLWPGRGFLKETVWKWN